MTTITTYTYKGADISFDLQGEASYINLTQMAKPFGKEPTHFLRNKQTEAFINELSRSANSQNEAIVKVKKGGTPELQGTWGHELLALKFAGWLSPKFELWMMERIRELLVEGQSPQANLQGVVERAVRVAGSNNKLARLIGISPGTLSFVNNGHWHLLSPDMCKKIAGYCHWLLMPLEDRDGMAEYMETMEMILRVENAELRWKLYEKMTSHFLQPKRT